MKLSPLQKKLLPSIEELSVTDMATTFYPIREDYIRSSLVTCDRLRERVIGATLAAWDIDYTKSAAQFDKEYILQSIVDVPYEEITLALGIMLNTRALAQAMIRSDQDRTVLKELPPNDLKVALSLREHAPDIRRPKIDRDSLLEDGRACFELWLEDVPEQIRNLLYYAYHQQTTAHKLEQTISQEEQSKMRKTADIWFLNWIERRPSDDDSIPDGSKEAILESG